MESEGRIECEHMGAGNLLLLRAPGWHCRSSQHLRHAKRLSSEELGATQQCSIAAARSASESVCLSAGGESSVVRAAAPAVPPALVDAVDKFHHGSNAGVEAQLLRLRGHLRGGRVLSKGQCGLCCGGRTPHLPAVSTASCQLMSQGHLPALVVAARTMRARCSGPGEYAYDGICSSRHK